MKAKPLATGQHKTHCALNYFKKSDCSAERSSLKKIMTTRLHTMVFKNTTFLALNAMITVGLPDDWQSENQIMVPEKSTFVISTLNILRRDDICVSVIYHQVCAFMWFYGSKPLGPKSKTSTQMIRNGMLTEKRNPWH